MGPKQWPRALDTYHASRWSFNTRERGKPLGRRHSRLDPHPFFILYETYQVCDCLTLLHLFLFIYAGPGRLDLYSSFIFITFQILISFDMAELFLLIHTRLNGSTRHVISLNAPIPFNHKCDSTKHLLPHYSASPLILKVGNGEDSLRNQR